MKQKNNETPLLITKDEKYINHLVSIANTFNNFFTSVAEIVHSKIKFSNKSCKNYWSSEINDSFLITSTNKEEIYKIISSLNRSLLSLIFINDLNIAIKNSETFHFTDDTCLLNIKDSIKKINKVVNKDLKFLTQWLHANKIAKTESLFSEERKSNLTLNLKICGKKLQASIYLKYLGIYLE